MPRFRYEALDATGQSHAGEIEANDVTRAAVELAAQSLVVLSIEMVPDTEPPVAAVMQAPGAGLGYEERINAVLGKPEETIRMLEALAAEPASNSLRKQLNYLLDRLREGINAQQFLSDPRLAIWLPVVMSGQRAPALESSYNQLLAEIIDERTRRRGFVAAFSYPFMLIGFAMLVVIPICVFIVPTFQKMFSEFGLSLPPPTRLLFSAADLVNFYPLQLLLGSMTLIALGAVGVYAWISRALTTQLFGWFIAGNSLSLVAMSRLTSVLAELIELGAPRSDALLLAGNACRHAYFRRASRKLAVHITDPNFSWQASPVAHNFPLALLHAFSAGEGQQASAPLIRELSHMYSHRVSMRLNKAFGAASPLMVIVVGVIVAMIVVALFMPLVQMVTSLT